MSEIIHHQDDDTIPKELSPINFATEASVGIVVSQHQDGSFIDESSSEFLGPILHKFSTMKHGHTPSTEYFADRLSQQTIVTPGFLSFIKSAYEQDIQVYITSPGIYNVPSASNILLKHTAARLNMFLSRHQMPTVVMADQTRLGESSLDYATKTVETRGKDEGNRSIMPEKFRGAYVIFVDDVYVSGTVAERTKKRLYAEGNVANAYFMFAMKIHSSLVQKTDGKIEDILNTYAVTGTLDSIKDVLTSKFTTVQKTLRVVLDPKNTSDLPVFLSEHVPNSALIDLYTACANNDFRNRWNGKYAPSIQILETIMEEKGLLRPDGSLVPTE